MIESLSIAKTATYGAEPQTLAGLARFNFLFGSNGAGKTTITKVIANAGAHPNCAVTWKKGTALEPLVYNRDFVERNFNAAPRLKGIFTLGEQDIANIEAIALKTAELGNIIKNIEQLTNTLHGQDQKSGKKGELTELEAHLKDKCWAQKQKHEDAFKDAFAGLRSNSERFKERTLAELASNKAELKAMDHLAQKAKTVFGETPIVEPTVPAIGVTGITNHESNLILAKKVIGKEDVAIAQLIQRLGNSDWVKQGQVFYGESKPTCPFCQQKVLDSFEASLTSYFDETFAKDTQTIVDLQEAYKRDADTLRARLTVQNTMRRILENYFKILGRIDFDKICDEFDGQQKAMCRSLFAWVSSCMVCCANSINVATVFIQRWNSVATPTVMRKFPTAAPSKTIKQSGWKSNIPVSPAKKCAIWRML